MKHSAILIAVLVVVHHAVVLIYDSVHNDLLITLSMFQKSFIYIIIAALPVIRVALNLSKYLDKWIRDTQWATLVAA